MFIEQRLEALESSLAAVTAELDRRDQTISAAIAEHKAQIDAALARVSASSGVSPAVLAQLLAAVAQNLYSEPTPPAPCSAATQDDGAADTTPALEPAQNEDALAGPLVEDAADEAADGGEQEQDVVAPSGEASASPAVDEPAPPKIDVVVDGRTVHGPRCSIFLTREQAQIVEALSKGPKSIDELASETGQTDKRMLLLRLANAKSTLRDAGIEPIVLHGKHQLVPYSKSR